MNRRRRKYQAVGPHSLPTGEPPSCHYGVPRDNALHPPHGRGCGVGRTLGMGVPRGVGVGRGVAVGVAVGVGDGVAHGASMYVRDTFCGAESGGQTQKSSV
jgi:hypothetical protein